MMTEDSIKMTEDCANTTMDSAKVTVDIAFETEDSEKRVWVKEIITNVKAKLPKDGAKSTMTETMKADD